MSSDNEREIRERLGGALDTMTPSQAPVGAVIAKGRFIRIRRRASVVAGVAVVAALAVALPGFIGHDVAPPPPEQPGYHITVNPPAPKAPNGAIGSGTLNGKPWTIRLAHRQGMGLVSIGTGLGSNGPSQVDTSPEGDPVNLGDQSSGPKAELVGSVRHDVTYLVLTLPGGKELRLQPVRWHGHRYVAILVPTQVKFVSLTAYGRHGEISRAIPFDGSEFVKWLRPGQRGLARQTITVGSGVIGGQRWTERAYVGPWGRCFGGAGAGGDCEPGADVPGPGKVASMDSCGGGPGAFFLGAVARSVSYVRLRMSDTSVVQVRAVSVAGPRYIAFAVAPGLRFVSWTAYDSNSRQLGTGRGWRC
jgi:hypothetical protein